MAKPSNRQKQPPQGSIKDLKPKFIRPRHILPVGTAKLCTFQFSRQPPQFTLISPK